ncbi:DUF692 domain-containing protein [Microbulbifer halophilus]|uniref:UPF0276 protein ACFSKX_10730 n=1 Tax=Microbulbifer halophilus TaxID=453963 RepID=A0ABW5EBC5_9GAMM|nr:DUF692 domain-containing protein [Microbulbifer halophilus]MCW8125963.1 DUF692 domain-containing protein [Microbulbifer halophilus]
MTADDSRGAPPGAAGTRLPSRAGVGLKPQHFTGIVESAPDIGFFEIHAENYFVAGGPFHHYLGRIREDYPLSVHGVGLSLGGKEPPDPAHLKALRTLLDRYQPHSFSEHLAWSGHGGTFVNDLLPLVYTGAALTRVCEHIEQVQDFLGRRMLLENPATYVEFEQSDYCETDFIGELVRRSGCGLLLDVNNVYVSCINHHRDARSYMAALPLDSVGEIHLAGFSRDRDAAGAPLLIDNHGSRVDRAVWQLYAELLERTGRLPTLIEWDNDVPGLDTLLAEAQRAEALLQSLPEPSNES